MNARLLLVAPFVLAASVLSAQQPGTVAAQSDGQNAPAPIERRGMPPMQGQMQGPMQGGMMYGEHERGGFEREPGMMRGGREHEGGRDGLGSLGLPHGEWWKNPEIVTRIGLTPDQTRRLDDLSTKGKIQLIHMHASLQEEELLLKPLVTGPAIDERKAEAQLDKVVDTRAEIEKASARMAFGLRAVLTPDQITKLSARHMGSRPDGHQMGGEMNHGQRGNGNQPPA